MSRAIGLMFGFVVWYVVGSWLRFAGRVGVIFWVVVEAVFR